MFKPIIINYFWTVSLSIVVIGILMNKFILIILGLFAFLFFQKRTILNRYRIKRNIGKSTNLKKEIFNDNNHEGNLKLKSSLNVFQEAYYKKLNISTNSNKFIGQKKFDFKTKFKSNYIKVALENLLEKEKIEEKEQRKKVEMENIKAENALKKIFYLEIERFKIIVEAMYKSGKSCRFLIEVLFRLCYLYYKLIKKKISLHLPVKLFIRSQKSSNIKRKNKNEFYTGKKHERTFTKLIKVDSQIIKREERLNKLEKEQILLNRKYRKVLLDLEKLMQDQ